MLIAWCFSSNTYSTSEFDISGQHKFLEKWYYWGEHKVKSVIPFQEKNRAVILGWTGEYFSWGPPTCHSGWLRNKADILELAASDGHRLDIAVLGRHGIGGFGHHVELLGQYRPNYAALL